MQQLLRFVACLAVIFAASGARADDATAPTGGVALSAALGVESSDYASDFRALRLEGAMSAFGPFKLGLALSVEQHLHAYTNNYLTWQDGLPSGGGGGSFHDDVMHMGTGGVVLAVGAPWTNGVFGASIEAGAAFGTVTSWPKPPAWDDVGAHNYGLARPSRPLFVSPYVQTTLVAQIPLRGHLHPFAALSGRWVADELGSGTPSCAAHVGVAWVGF